MRKLVVLVIFLTLSFVPANAQIREILKRISQHQNALKTLRADIAINKFSVQAGGGYTKEGALTIVPQKNGNHSVRLDSTKPEEQNFLIVANQYLIYLPARKIAYTGAATEPQKLLFISFLDLSKETLKLDYDIAYTGEEKIGGTIPTWHLELTPKKPLAYDKIELWVDANGMPLQWKINETSGDWTSVLLSNLKKNVALNAAEFRINLPKNTKIVKGQKEAANRLPDSESPTPTPLPDAKKKAVRKPKSKIKRRS